MIMINYKCTGDQRDQHLMTHSYLTRRSSERSGCKRVCDGLAFESVADATDPALCDDQRCFDEILLSGLQARLVPDGRDRIVVLHMLGNHGPAYYRSEEPTSELQSLMRTSYAFFCLELIQPHYKYDTHS